MHFRGPMFWNFWAEAGKAQTNSIDVANNAAARKDSPGACGPMACCPAIKTTSLRLRRIARKLEIRKSDVGAASHSDDRLVDAQLGRWLESEGAAGGDEIILFYPIAAHADPAHEVT